MYRATICPVDAFLHRQAPRGHAGGHRPLRLAMRVNMSNEARTAHTHGMEWSEEQMNTGAKIFCIKTELIYNANTKYGIN